MMEHIKRLLGYPRTKPVSIKEATSAPEPDSELERRSKIATARLTGELMAVERKSHEIRQELAHNTLKILAVRGGGRH